MLQMFLGVHHMTPEHGMAQKLRGKKISGRNGGVNNQHTECPRTASFTVAGHGLVPSFILRFLLLETSLCDGKEECTLESIVLAMMARWWVL